ncbi:MAG: helix-turn-helix transcriptional regulator [Bacteroidales bacterium]|nr:helix-turn-helix transcriptional regulator [Bacteroidales bacterium]
MKQKTLDYLESHQSKTPSSWRSDAEWRRDNKAWLWHSKHIAVKLLMYMKQEQLTQSAMAERLGCTQQFVSKILKGTENLSLETLTKLEQAMGIQLIVD